MLQDSTKPWVDWWMDELEDVHVKLDYPNITPSGNGLESLVHAWSNKKGWKVPTTRRPAASGAPRSATNGR